MFQVDTLIDEKKDDGVPRPIKRFINMVFLKPSDICIINQLETELTNEIEKNKEETSNAIIEQRIANRQFDRKANSKAFDYGMLALAEQLEIREERVIELTNAGTVLQRCKADAERLRSIKVQSSAQTILAGIYRRMASIYASTAAQTGIVEQRIHRELIDDIQDEHKETFNERTKGTFSKNAIMRVRKVYEARGLEIPDVKVLKISGEDEQMKEAVQRNKYREAEVDAATNYARVRTQSESPNFGYDNAVDNELMKRFRKLNG